MRGCRPRDRLWDALVEAMGTQAPLTRSARGAWNAAHRELREAGITPEQVLEAARCYRQEWPDMVLTPNALTKHLHLFVDVPSDPTEAETGDSLTPGAAAAGRRETDGAPQEGGPAGSPSDLLRQAAALIWVDPVELGNPAAKPIVLQYPDGSTSRGRWALIDGPSELVYRPEGYPDGKHVALETYADVELA